MRMDDRHNVGPDLVNLAMNVALAVNPPAARIDRLAVRDIEVEKIVLCHQRRRHGARNDKYSGILRRAHRDMPEAVEDAFVHQDFIRGNEVFLALPLQFGDIDRIVHRPLLGARLGYDAGRRQVMDGEPLRAVEWPEIAAQPQHGDIGDIA